MAELEDRQKQAKAWIEQILKTKFADNNLSAVLHDSKVLCRLINEFIPDCVPEKQFLMDPIPDFQCLENIGLFVEECRKLGVKENSLFLTADLHEEKNIGLVVDCILNLKKIVEHKNFDHTRAKVIYKKKQERERQKTKLYPKSRNTFLRPVISTFQFAKGIFSWCVFGVQIMNDYCVIPFIMSIAVGIGIKLGRSTFMSLTSFQ